jgi:hypothetical protein
MLDLKKLDISRAPQFRLGHLIGTLAPCSETAR